MTGSSSPGPRCRPPLPRRLRPRYRRPRRPRRPRPRRPRPRRGSPMDPRDVIIRPVVSEKSYALLDKGVYTFVVHPDANKIEIRQAVEAVFNVRVANVNTLNRKGKRK